MKILFLHRGGLSGTGGATYAESVIRLSGARHDTAVFRDPSDLDRDWDVVHALDMKHLDPSLAARVRAPLVVDVHDAHWADGEPFYPTPDWPLRVALALKRRPRYKAILDKSAAVVVHSRYVKDRLGLAKAHVVPYSVGAIEPGPPFAERPPEILFAGRDYFRKGLPTLLKAWKIVSAKRPDARLFVAGREFLHGDIYARLFARGESITLLGGVERSDLIARMRRARAVVLPSWVESFGITLIEAMAAGAVAIGSRCGGIVEALRDGEAGLLFPVGDHKALADAIISALDNDVRVADLSAKTRAVVAEHSESAMIDALEKVYAEAASR